MEFNENLSPVKEKRHAKILTMVSGILTLVLAIALLFCVVYLVYVFFNFLQGSGSQADQIAGAIVGIILVPLMLAFCFICVALAIMYLVLGIFLMTSAFKDDKVFARRRGFVVTTIVFDFIAIVLLVIFALSIQMIAPIFLAVAAVMFVGTVLKMVDLKLHTKRIRNAKIENASVTISNEQTSSQTTVNSTVNFSALNPKNNAEKEEKLKKLEEMKSAGLISDKEFEEMKQKVWKE